MTYKNNANQAERREVLSNDTYFRRASVDAELNLADALQSPTSPLVKHRQSSIRQRQARGQMRRKCHRKSPWASPSMISNRSELLLRSKRRKL
jgi:hypothetical protein